MNVDLNITITMDLAETIKAFWPMIFFLLRRSKA